MKKNIFHTSIGSLKVSNLVNILPVLPYTGGK